MTDEPDGIHLRPSVPRSIAGSEERPDLARSGATSERASRTGGSRSVEPGDPTAERWVTTRRA
jgi:hypothetical protein